MTSKMPKEIWAHQKDFSNVRRWSERLRKHHHSIDHTEKTKYIHHATHDEAVKLLREASKTINNLLDFEHPAFEEHYAVLISIDEFLKEKKHD